MLLGIILIIGSLIGIIFGIVKKSKTLVIGAAIMLIAIAAIGIYFSKNPY